MSPLLPFLFAVVIQVVPPPITSPEPLHLPPHFSPQVLADLSWDTHHEDFIAAMAVPEPELAPLEIAAAPATEEGRATRMGNGTSDVEEWRPLVAGQFPPEQVDNALCVIKMESGGEPHIRNLQGSNARGLFQIMTTVWGPYFGFSHEDFYVPELNVYAAYIIWRDHGGWKHWSSRTKNGCGL